MKKFISGILAIGITLSSVLSFTSSSAFDPTKDPNGDGHLTIADSTAILQYLGGYHNPSDLTQLDVDNNGVVSIVDSEYIVMYDAGMINRSIEQSVESTATNSTSTSRSYVVYNAQTGTIDRNYTLQVYNTTNSTNNARNVIGNDDRYENWSNKGVAKIMCNTTENSNGYLGTGFVVGSHTIATAAHVTFKRESNRGYKISNILLFDGENNPHSFTPVETHIPLNYKLYDYNPYDYSLITVEEDLSEFMSFNLGAITNDAFAAQIPIKLAGFPSLFNGETVNDADDHCEMVSEGVLNVATQAQLSDGLIRYNADASNGNSGSPVYTTEILNGQTYNTLIGIHITSANNGNAAVRFDSHILKFLKSNSNIQY